MDEPIEPGQWMLEPGQAWDPSLLPSRPDDEALHSLASSAFWGLDTDTPAWLDELSRMTAGQRMLISTSTLEGAVNNGGFQKLWFYWPWALRPAIDGYRLIGVERLALLLETVERTADWSGVWNGDRDAGCPPAEFDRPFYELATWDTPGAYPLGQLKNAYMKAHPEQFPRAVRPKRDAW